MRLFVLLLLFALLFAACGTKPLARRLVGVWSVEHYEEFGPGGWRTGHALDNLGRVVFSKNKTGRKTVSSGARANRFGRLPQFVWGADDSVVTLYSPDSTKSEVWLVTKGYSSFMEWVTVEGDSQRVLYLIKR